MYDFESLSDEELVKIIREELPDAFSVLAARYIPRIKYIISSLTSGESLPYDIDDLIQESLLALYLAVRVYDFSQSSFATFATVCIKRAVIGQFRKELRKKNIPRGRIVSLDESSEVSVSGPEQLLISKENQEAVLDRFKSVLSELEFKALFEYLATGSYDKTAEKLGISVKQVDNAVARARKKIRNISID